MEKRPRLLMIYVQYSTFIKRDIEILNSEYKVDTYCFATQHKKKTPLAFIKQFFFLLFHLYKYEACVIQSSGYVSYLPTLLGKITNVPTFIIAIGMDCAKLPEINYGAHRSKLLSWFTCQSFYQASKILPVHKSLSMQTYTYEEVKFKKQGILSFCPNLKTPIQEVVNGYDTQKWQLLNTKGERVKNSFLTVTMVEDAVGFKRKGLDLILAFAKTKPEFVFTIVGKIAVDVEIPSNVSILAPMPQEKLVEVYNLHEYYLQLSMFEGFPNALCESMLCGCIPITSNVSGIPDIVGDVGFVLKKKSVSQLVSLVNVAQKSELEPLEVRNRIVALYPLERRAKELIHQIKNT